MALTIGSPSLHGHGAVLRTRRHIVRSLVVVALLGVLFRYTLTHSDISADTLHAYTHHFPGLHSFTSTSNPNALPNEPTYLWSYVPDLPSDAESIISTARAATTASDPDAFGRTEDHLQPLVDGFEWVQSVRRRSGLTEGEAARLDEGGQDSQAGWAGGMIKEQVALAHETGEGGVARSDGEDQDGHATGRSGPGIRPSAPRRPSWGALKLQGAKKSVQTNLRDDSRYFVAFPIAGFTNQVMDLFTSIHLAILSSRIPVIAPIMPDTGHLGGPAAPLPLGDVFDLSFLSALKETPIVEMHELKTDFRSAERNKVVVYDGEVPVRPGGVLGEEEWQVGDGVPAEEPEGEDIGCWSSGLSWHDSATWWGGMDPASLHLTPLPREAFAGRWERQSIHTTADIINTQNADVLANHSVPYDSFVRLGERNLPIPPALPSDRLACMDSAYWALQDPERNDGMREWREGMGTWRAVGQYMRFQPGLIRMAEDLLRAMWGLGWREEVPVYMAVHIRRTDFNAGWRALTQRQIMHRAWQVIREARLHLGIGIKHVVVTTDETDQEWIAPFRQAGWTVVDHAKYETGAKLGYWFPTVLDAVILSRAKVFLGNPSSTMSILPYRRVVDWNQGLARYIAHDHKVPDDWEWHLDWSHA